jgi:hypothetical protein
MQVRLNVPGELVAALVPAGRNPGHAAVQAMAVEDPGHEFRNILSSPVRRNGL